MPRRINLGDAIPIFKTRDNEGEELIWEDLIGSPVVLYFYPKDNTPGCTKEACAFRDKMPDFDFQDTLVIGISPDNAASHEKFIETHNLNFTLIPDVKLDLCRKFGVIKSENPVTIERTTFVADSEGIVRWIERPVDVEGHAERVLKAVMALQKDQIKDL